MYNSPERTAGALVERMIAERKEEEEEFEVGEENSQKKGVRGSVVKTKRDVEVRSNQRSSAKKMKQNEKENLPGDPASFSNGFAKMHCGSFEEGGRGLVSAGGMTHMKSYENLSRVIEDLVNEDQSSIFAASYSSLTKADEETKIGSARNINRSMDKREREQRYHDLSALIPGKRKEVERFFVGSKQFEHAYQYFTQSL